MLWTFGIANSGAAVAASLGGVTLPEVLTIAALYPVCAVFVSRL